AWLRNSISLVERCSSARASSSRRSCSCVTSSCLWLVIIASPHTALASFPLCWRFLLAKANKLFTASTKACAPPGSKYIAPHFVQTSARIPETETRSPSRSNSWVMVRERTTPPHSEQVERRKSFITFLSFLIDPFLDHVPHCMKTNTIVSSPHQLLDADDG